MYERIYLFFDFGDATLTLAYSRVCTLDLCVVY